MENPDKMLHIAFIRFMTDALDLPEHIEQTFKEAGVVGLAPIFQSIDKLTESFPQAQSISIEEIANIQS